MMSNYELTEEDIDFILKHLAGASECLDAPFWKYMDELQFTKRYRNRRAWNHLKKARREVLQAMIEIERTEGTFEDNNRAMEILRERD